MRFLPITLLAVLLTGCASTGTFNTQHLTNVQLGEPNYRVVATNVAGEASASYVFGVSGAVGNEMRTLALARVGGERNLYDAAFADLWTSFEAAEGPAAGRRIALVNVRYDSDALNLVLYTEARVAIRADIVEFE